MNKDKFIFSQLTDFLDRFKFRRLVDKYKGDSHVKTFSCWNQLLTLMFGQLSGRESLRDLVVALEAHKSKCFHLGLGTNGVSRTTLAEANQKRDFRIFEEFAFFMMDEARKFQSNDIFRLGSKVYAFDSTTIPLCLSLFKWARFRRGKAGIKVHVLYDLETSVPAYYHITEAVQGDSKTMKEISYESGAYYVFDRGYNSFADLFRINRLESFFVVRAKQNLRYKAVRWKRRMPKNVLTDAEIQLDGEQSQQKYPETLSCTF